MRKLLALSLIMACPGPGFTAPLNLAFLPPQVQPAEICRSSPDELVDEIIDEDGEGDDGIDDPMDEQVYLRFLRRDIRNLSVEDADRWFDYVMDLIDLRLELDPNFTEIDAQLARAALYVDAGRLDELLGAGLLDLIRARITEMDGAQKLALAEYYLNGTGVPQNLQLGQALLREAAYAGNPDALLTIARLEVRGEPVPEWDAPLEVTVSFAFGGLLGEMNPGICFRAENIGDAYLTGDIVARNPSYAMQWYKFSADLGGVEGAWRVAEAHLTGSVPNPDRATMLQYLELAVRRGFTPDAEAQKTLAASADIPAEIMARLLGPDAERVTSGQGTRASLHHLLRLETNPDVVELDDESDYMRYLRRVSKFDTAPGFVFTLLANEIMLRRGRWAGEAEVIPILEEAALRGDTEGMRLLAEIHLRYRRDPAQLSRAISLLSEAATRFGDPMAMLDLEGLYRCQLVEAPRLDEATIWFDNLTATGMDPVDINPNDLIVLDEARDPEAIAAIQTLALMREPVTLGRMLERIQVDELLGESADLMWANRTSGSKKALETFAILEFSLATTPLERDLAIKLFRRVYQNNGVTTALDLATALVEHNGREARTAQEIEMLLTEASERGEGGAIRLLSRLVSDKRRAETLEVPVRTEAEIYAEFAQIIEDNGDFLALMFAIPHVDDAKARDYIERAVSVMNCGTKDVEELGDVHAILAEPDMTYHWREVGLAIVGGHSLSRLALTNRQMDLYATGAAPEYIKALEAAVAAGKSDQREPLYRLISDPDSTAYNPKLAAEQLVNLLQGRDAGSISFALRSYQEANYEIRQLVDSVVDVRPMFRDAAASGDPRAKFQLAMVLRQMARGASDLAESADFLKQSAESGDAEAMVAYGKVLLEGLGVDPDEAEALKWFQKAANLGDPEGIEMARLVPMLR